MFSPKRALHRAQNGSEPLPTTDEMQPLHNKGFLPRRGEFVMIAGQPSSGKSALGLWWVNAMGVDGLYFAADMTAHQISTRLGALRTGHTVTQVADALENEDSPEYSFYEDAIAGSNIMFNFQSAPSMVDVVEELEAYLEVFNQYPTVIGVDNLRNFCDEQDYQLQQVVVADCQTLARETGSTVVLLHHTTEATSRAVEFPQARKDIKNKLGELPEWILTVAVDQATDVFRVAMVKARGAKHDPTGEDFVEFVSDLSRASFTPKPVWVPSWGGASGQEWWQK